MKRILFVVFFILIAFLALGGRRHIYSSYQHLGNAIGLNFNNIAGNDYVSFIKSQSGDFEGAGQAVYLNHPVSFIDTVATIIPTKILGQSTGGKWIDINLSEQRLYMKEGDNTIASFLVSTGRWAPTPTGTFAIWTKLRYTRMTGGSQSLGTYYDLPNVPYTMFFYQGYGIHGTYWHNNFGHPMSHGCVNMKTEEAAVVYNWADVGTKVVIHD